MYENIQFGLCSNYTLVYDRLFQWISKARDSHYYKFAYQMLTQLPGAPLCTFMRHMSAEVSVLPLPKFPNNKKSSDIPLAAANGSTIYMYGRNLLNIILNLRRDFPFVFLIADISGPIIGADFLSKCSLLVDAKHKRLAELLLNRKLILEILRNYLSLPADHITKLYKTDHIIGVHVVVAEPEIERLEHLKLDFSSLNNVV
uniref:Uncharacterized protein n=1 Tax=Glossina palpalis gambiensis TaxID=67801 RepID=A0A1B0BSH5_9MUSC